MNEINTPIIDQNTLNNLKNFLTSLRKQRIIDYRKLGKKEQFLLIIIIAPNRGYSEQPQVPEILSKEATLGNSYRNE